MTTPTLLFDGDCAFCRRWVARWRTLTRGEVHYMPYQEALPSFPEVSKWQSERAIQLILPDHQVYSGAHAVFKVLEIGGKHRWLLKLYDGFGPFRWCAEAGYGVVARHRPFFSKLVKPKRH